MSNQHGIINNDSSIIITTTTHITVEAVMEMVEKKYEGITKPHAKMEHERYAYRDSFSIRNCLYESEINDSMAGVLWVKADKIFVPYNRDLMIETVKETMKAVATTEPTYYRGTVMETIAYNAVLNYRSSKYYVETYKQLADECVKEMNEKYGVPEYIRKAQHSELKSKELRENIEFLSNRIDLDDLPKSTPTRVKDLLHDLRNGMVNMIDKYDRFDERVKKNNMY